MFRTDRGDSGRRLDLVVRRHLAGTDTRTRVQGWIAGGAVTVNGDVVTRAAARLAAGDLVAVTIPGAQRRLRSHSMAAEDLPLDVLFEDDHLVIVNKQAGVVVHPTYRHTDGTIMNALLWRARGWPPTDRPSIVGRLDKLTSGLVVAAKRPAVHAALQRALASSRTEKDYLALVYGRVKPIRGEIDLPLRRDPRDRRRVIASSADGAASLTRFVRLGAASAAGVNVTLLQCRLLTGRMHQIRVHLAAKGWPIVGDPKYGDARWAEIVDPELRAVLAAFPRQALHAWRLTVAHPVTGARVHVEAPLPADLAALLARAGLVQSAR